MCIRDSHHQELLDPHWWRQVQRRIKEETVLPIPAYPPELRLAAQARRPRQALPRATTDRHFSGVIPD